MKRIAGLTILLLFLFSNSAFATHWVPLQYENESYWIDEDTAIKQGSTLIFWLLMDDLDPGTLKHGILTAKQEFKFEVDLRTPEKIRSTMAIWFDFNDRRIRAPYPALRPWGPLHADERPMIDLALSLAKEGLDTGVIPSSVSDH